MRKIKENQKEQPETKKGSLKSVSFLSEATQDSCIFGIDEL